MVTELDTPDDCPFHHLDPDVTVYIREEHIMAPRSAALACETWHQTAPVRALVAELLADMQDELRGDMSGEPTGLAGLNPASGGACDAPCEFAPAPAIRWADDLDITTHPHMPPNDLIVGDRWTLRDILTDRTLYNHPHGDGTELPPDMRENFTENIRRVMASVASQSWSTGRPFCAVVVTIPPADQPQGGSPGM